MKANKILANVVGGCAAVLLIAFASKQEGYQFVWHMLQSNLKTIKEYHDASLSDRYLMKLGSGYAIYKYVTENTPKNAIVYLPEAKYFREAGIEGEPWNKLWAMRFLYPRQVVTEREYRINHKRPTHVLILGEGGREILPPGSIPSSSKIAIVPFVSDSIR